METQNNVIIMLFISLILTVFPIIHSIYVSGKEKGIRDEHERAILAVNNLLEVMEEAQKNAGVSERKIEKIKRYLADRTMEKLYSVTNASKKMLN